MIVNTHPNITPRLLLVASDPELLHRLSDVFHESYGLLIAPDGDKALQCVNGEPVDAIIADVAVPFGSSLRMCETLKSKEHTALIPFLLVGNRDVQPNELAGLEAGADDFICWPCDIRMLQLKLRNMIFSRRWRRQVLHISKGGRLASNEDLVRRATESIERNLSNSQYTADDLGRDMMMSRAQLYRKLKGATGQSANELIRSVRLKRAAMLIRGQRHTIAEVTYSVGFTDLTYFRNCFKKMFGVNPSEYHQHITRSVTLDHFHSRLA